MKWIRTLGWHRGGAHDLCSHGSWKYYLFLSLQRANLENQPRNPSAACMAAANATHLTPGASVSNLIVSTHVLSLQRAVS